MADNLGTTVSVAQNGTETYYLPGHPLYDAVRLDVDSSATGSADSTIEFRTYDNDDVRAAKDNGDFSSMDEVDTFSNVDASSGDPSYGTDALGGVVAVQISENANTADGIDGTLVLHNSSDPIQNAHAFLNRHDADA